MSWSGFKKNVGRATTQVMMKTGHVEKTSDRDYEVEERRYRTLESASLRLQKEAKGYLDSLRAMTASQMRIAETIDAFYGESGAKDGVSRSYKQAVEDLDAETVKALDGPYRCVTRDPELIALVKDNKDIYPPGILEEIEAELNWKRGSRHYTQDFYAKEDSESLELIEFVYRTTVLEPINRFCAYFPDINECIKKRNHKMLDYDSMRSKVKKLTEKPDKDPSKLPRTEKETEMVIDVFTLFRAAPSHDPPDSADEEMSLLVPSPPKVLDGLKHKSRPDHSPTARKAKQSLRSDSVLSIQTDVTSKRDSSSSLWTDDRSHRDSSSSIQANEDAALESIGMLRKSSSLRKKAGRLHRAFWALPQDGSPQSPASPSPSSMEKRRSLPAFPSPDASSTDASPLRSSFLSVRGGGMVPPVSPHFLHSPTFSKLQFREPEDTPTRKTAAAAPSDDTPPRISMSFLQPLKTELDESSLLSTGNSPGSSKRNSSLLSPSLLEFIKEDQDGPPSVPGPDSPSAIQFKDRLLSRHLHPKEKPKEENEKKKKKKKKKKEDPTKDPSRTTQKSYLNPSELEDIMAPLRLEFLERQADNLAQAKAAYLQLNEQLTNELPQLIDLRVPYLDPSFEALVKIQLRFCAEAYSRMAQVQQYLDASTRDQYANGDLDARVEDVLGQIRELSIAGTV